MAKTQTSESFPVGEYKTPEGNVMAIPMILRAASLLFQRSANYMSVNHQGNLRASVQELSLRDGNLTLTVEYDDSPAT